LTRETEGLSPSHYLTLAKAKCSRKSQVEHGWQAVQGEQIVHVVERGGESWQTVKIEQEEKVWQVEHGWSVLCRECR
jgi:hypothetical protein